MIPLRADPCADLMRWNEMRGPGSPTPSEVQSGARRRSTEPLFAVSPNLVRVFNRDSYFAGVLKREEGGRTVCVNSLRHTFATLLSRGGVAPRVAPKPRRGTPRLN